MINLFSKQQVENDMDQQTVHIPVMAQEVMQFLNLKPGAIVVDGTLGTAGHSQMMAQAISPGGQLIGIDRDGHSLAVAAQRLKEFSSQCHLIQDDYRNLNQILHQLGIQEVDAMLFDLGISSYQLDNPERGFSLKLEGPLDMRMDQESFISAYDLVNSLSEREISTILRNFGQERWHNRIAHYLVAQRVRNPIESTKDLTDTILKAIPHRYHYQKIHPATRTFQAIRIAVNRELEALEIVLDKSIDSLKVGGRIAVIAFHSLEDRIVKEKFRTFAKAGRLQLLTKKPLRPTDQETDNNPRSRSARLRVAQRLK
ncbi:MAG TPA: 16S rRNA (cytosine(1402)-N(4))-methyltransferase RsmH [Candidatus Omnitrophota bacterium]|nr:16S rRNA (cytosine(1402)-N(4))-methyltransferase RsmH [Candidatus Omnitrophota bacterium]